MPHITIPSCLHCKSVLCPNQCQQSPCEKLASWVPPNRTCNWYIYTHTKISKLSLVVLPYEQHLNQSLVLFFIMFIPCFRMGKGHGWGTFQKCGTMLYYCLILGPFDFWMPPTLRPTLHEIPYETRNQKTQNIFPSVGEHPYLEHFNRVAWDSAHHTCNSSCNHWWRNPGHRYTHWLTTQQIDLRGVFSCSPTVPSRG